MGKLAVLALAIVLAFSASNIVLSQDNNGQVVYINDFEGTVGSEWSTRETAITPIHERRFLGQFSNETVSLTLDSLPSHSTVTVSFDLLVIRSWDGDRYGDIWELTADNVLLVQTTFDNQDFYDDHTQSYPGTYPEDSNPPRSGAMENNTLGYTFRDARFGEVAMDSVYRMALSFSHSSDTLVLRFSARGLQDIQDESWGLDNVQVTLEPASEKEPSPLNCDQFDLTYRPLTNPELYALLNIEMSDELSSVAAITLVNGMINQNGCLFFEVEARSTNYATYRLRVSSAYGDVSNISQTWIDITTNNLSVLTAMQTTQGYIMMYPDSHIGIQLNKWGFEGPSDTYVLRFTDWVQTVRIALNQGLIDENEKIDFLAVSEEIMSELADESKSPELHALSVTIDDVRAGTENNPEILLQSVFDWGKLLLEHPALKDIPEVALGGASLDNLLSLGDLYAKYLEIQPIWNDVLWKPDGVAFDITYAGERSVGMRIDGSTGKESNSDLEQVTAENAGQLERLDVLGRG